VQPKRVSAGPPETLKPSPVAWVASDQPGYPQSHPKRPTKLTPKLRPGGSASEMKRQSHNPRMPRQSQGTRLKPSPVAWVASDQPGYPHPHPKRPTKLTPKLRPGGSAFEMKRQSHNPRMPRQSQGTRLKPSPVAWVASDQPGYPHPPPKRPAKLTPKFS